MSSKISKSVIQQYLTLNLLEELGIDKWPPEERDSFLESFADIIHMKIVGRLIDSMTGDQQRELDELLAQNPSDTVLANSILKIIPDFETLVQEEIAIYKKQLLDDITSLLQKKKV